MGQKEWKFTSLNERVKITGASLAAIAVYGAGLSAVFNPLAIGVAAGYAGYSVAKVQISRFHPIRDFLLNRSIKKGRYTELPKDHRLAQIVGEVNQQLGRKKVPRILLVGEDTVAKMSAPPGLRRLVKPLVRKNMHKVFAASPDADILITTQAALDKNLSEKQLRFIVAHEMSHIKMDKDSTTLLGGLAIKKATRALVLGGLAVMALGAFGVALPMAFTSSMPVWGGLLALGGIRMAADIGIKYAHRIIERRADRNALYLTKDKDGAFEAMDMLHKDAPYHAPALVEIFQSHPSFTPRVQSLKEAWNKVAANDNKKQDVSVVPSKEDIKRLSRQRR